LPYPLPVLLFLIYHLSTYPQILGVNIGFFLHVNTCFFI
jgi:hypothetical protein